jgi:hypothetical protein
MLGAPGLSPADLERALQDGEFLRDCKELAPEVKQRVEAVAGRPASR